MFGTRWLLAQLADHSQQYYKQYQLQPQTQPLLTLTPSKNECKLFALQSSSYVIARLDPFRLSVEPAQKPECVPIFYAGVVKRAIRNALMAIEFDKADALYTTVNRWYLAENFAALRQYWCEHHRSAGKKQIKTLLSAYDFAQADLVAERYAPVLHSDDYLPNKRSYVQQYFEQRYQTALNDEQLTSLISSSHNVLLTARAGSGKTRVIVCKTALQIAYGALPDQILLLAFNKKAAGEMATRIEKEFGLPDFATARTFHGLAYQIVRPTKQLEDDEQSQLKLISTALKSIKDKRFMTLLKEFLTSSDMEDDEREMKKDDPAYLTYRRNLRQITLSGVAVKSIGEKWIADFLFEQGIWFEYEKIYLANGHPYRPDFTLHNLQRETVILEHWGVSSAEPNNATIFDGNTTAGAYRAQMWYKRRYWQNCNTVLIESSIDDMRKGREFFTNQLANKLNAAGIIGHPLSESELLEKLEEIHLDRFGQLLQKFIQRAKNQQLTSLDIHKLLQRLPSAKRIRTFWHLAYQVFCAYEQILLGADQIDYNDMLVMAAKEIDANKGHCYIEEKVTHRKIWIDQLQWLLIDEFQDFTPGFDLMVQAMRRNNPQLRLYCVGDDWQAINGFAGSDLSYFRAFNQKIEQSAVLYLQMNQRSQQAIVKAGNQLMRDQGRPSTWREDKSGGTIHIQLLDAISFGKHDNVDNQRFRPSGRGYDNGFLTSRCLKFCYALITEPKHQNKRIAILSRTNQIYSSKLDDFKRDLFRLLGRGSEQYVDISTIHKYKGLEADITILVEITADRFPLIHPDTPLMAPFLPQGIDPVSVALEEERRLFYVALSRAREECWILTDSKWPSPFLENL